MKRQYLSILLIICVPCARSFSQLIAMNPESISIPSSADHEPSTDMIDLFASEEVLQMTLIFDMKKFIRTKNRPEYYPATLIVKFNETDSVSLNIKIKARGFMRRTYCSFPPIMLKLKNKDEVKHPLGNENIKLVTHCQGSSSFESYVFKEYLTYKLFNLVTPYSFKTRLVKITYADANKSKKTITAFGFLIENEKKLAERNNSVIINNMQITQKHMIASDMARFAIFNYMIGNTDWSIPLQHNVKVLKSFEVSLDKGIPVAYDFDYSGLVNTYYSMPAEGLPIKNVSERYYMGVCMPEDELKPVLEEFEGLHEKFIKTIDEFEYLKVSDKKQAEMYINSFYKNYRSHQYIITDLNRTCKRF